MTKSKDRPAPTEDQIQRELDALDKQVNEAVEEPVRVKVTLSRKYEQALTQRSVSARRFTNNPG